MLSLIQFNEVFMLNSITLLVHFHEQKPVFSQVVLVRNKQVKKKVRIPYFLKVFHLSIFVLVFICLTQTHTFINRCI